MDFTRNCTMTRSAFLPQLVVAILVLALGSPFARGAELPNNDASNATANARVIYVSSGSLASRASMNSGSGRTSLRFSGSDLHPTVIFEFAQSQQIHQVDAAYPTSGAKLDIYLLNDLPQRGGFLGQKPIASLADSMKRAETAVEIAPTSARYLILRWTRDKATGEPFEVAELNAMKVVSPEKEEGAEQANTTADSSTFRAPPDPPKILSLSP